MSDRGRHSRGSGPAFYKDVLLLVAGILIVGALVFGGLSLWAGRDDGSPPTDTGPSADATTTSTTIVTADTDAAPTSTIGSTLATTPDETAAPPTTDTTAPATTVRDVRAPADVRVVVLNSIGVNGLAGELTADIAEAGYQTAEPDNYTPELSDTMIFHADGFALEALELGGLVPDGTVAPDTEVTAAQGVDVVVVIGLSYQE